MVARNNKRIVIPTAICLALILILLVNSWSKHSQLPSISSYKTISAWSSKGSNIPEHTSSWQPRERTWTPGTPRNAWAGNDLALIQRPKNYPVPDTHRELVSLSTPDGAYLMIYWGEHYGGINPNMIPHPRLNDTWIIVAQQSKSRGFPHYVDDYDMLKDEMTCLARFSNNRLSCIHPPSILPISNAPTAPLENCDQKPEWVTVRMSMGPHDARIINGPDFPIAVWGEKSQYVCFGIWMQDFRTLVDWGLESYDEHVLRQAVEIRRPPPKHMIEKNYFPFWDDEGTMYAHFDIAPSRAFAKLLPDGSTGRDLALLTHDEDQKCMKAYMPIVGERLEDIHQATNSLSITLCDRADPDCVPDNDNTFIIFIWQWKSYWSFHGRYEPYVALFRRTAPFDLYALSNRPMWVRGRGGRGEGKVPDPNANDEILARWEQTEMVYFTSMAWKDHGIKYAGHQDDTILLGFGVEDNYTALVDIKASDLLLDLKLCADAGDEPDPTNVTPSEDAMNRKTEER